MKRLRNIQYQQRHPQQTKQKELLFVVIQDQERLICYLMNYILNKLNPNYFYIVCRSNDQYPNNIINQNTEIKPLECYRNKTVVFDDMLCSKRARDIDQFFTRSRHDNINVYYISQSW